MKKRWVVIIICFAYAWLHAITVGSYDTVSRQGQVIFPSEDTDNQIVGFTFMEEGFILEDGKTTCSINNQFEFAGDMFFNGGILYLLNDFILKQGARGFSPPTIYGDNRKVILPFVQNTAVLPASFYPNFVDGANFNNTISSLDWDATNQWIAISLSTGSSDEIQFIYFDGTTAANRFALGVDENVDPFTLLLLGNTTINVVRWNPVVPILAVGADPGSNDELLLYEFDNTTTALTEADTAAVGDSVTALSWHPSGTWLAVGTANTTDEVRVFNFNSGTNTVASLDTHDLSPDRSIAKDAMSWNSSGDYLAVGTSSDGAADELLVYYFDESTITVTASVDVGATVSAVDWHPSLPLLAVGLSEGLQKTRIYSFNSAAATLTELTNARTDELVAVTSLEWHKDGVMLLVNKAPNPGFATHVYFYNPIAQTLTLYNQAKQIDTINDARWSPNGLFFAQGGDANSLYIHSSDIAAVKLIDITLLIRSKLTFLGAVLFSGTSSVDAARNTLDISFADKVLVGSNTTLLFKNLTFKGVSDDTFCLTDDTSKVIFDNATILIDDVLTFSWGAIEFKNKVHIGGSGRFVYQTNQTMTINTKTRLVLEDSITFSYDPVRADSRDLIEFTDDSSELYLNDCTLHATTTGLRLQKGCIRVLHDSTISSETEPITEDLNLDQGISIGGGASSQDCKLMIDSAAELIVAQGTLEYNNVLASSFIVGNDRSIININTGATLRLLQDLNLGMGRALFKVNSRLARVIGKKLNGSIDVTGQILFTSLVE